jgi:hypothetical protein
MRWPLLGQKMDSPPVLERSCTAPRMEKFSNEWVVRMRGEGLRKLKWSLVVCNAVFPPGFS